MAMGIYIGSSFKNAELPVVEWNYNQRCLYFHTRHDNSTVVTFAQSLIDYTVIEYIKSKINSLTIFVSRSYIVCKMGIGPNMGLYRSFVLTFNISNIFAVSTRFGCPT